MRSSRPPTSLSGSEHTSAVAPRNRLGRPHRWERLRGCEGVSIGTWLRPSSQGCDVAVQGAGTLQRVEGGLAETGEWQDCDSQVEAWGVPRMWLWMGSREHNADVPTEGRASASRRKTCGVDISLGQRTMRVADGCGRE